jgi:hypothetical protein
MPTQVPGELTAVSIAVLDGGAVAEAVVSERMECFARLHADGAWSDWWSVAGGVRSVCVAADASQHEPSALIAVVVLVPVPLGAFAVTHTLYQETLFRLTTSGVAPADDL